MKKQIKIKVKEANMKAKAKSVNPWQVHLKDVYAKMKVKNKSVKLSDAMKAAKETYACKVKKK